MKLNISNPATGAQKNIEIDDENRLRVFMDKRMAEEIEGDELGDEFRGYVFKITGGNDKDGFPMRQGVLVPKRVRLLLRRGMPCFRASRKGERSRKSVRGCIIAHDIAALSLVIVKRGPGDLPGLTDIDVPRRLGPKRVDKIRKMFNLSKEDDPRDFIVRRKVKTKNGKTIIKKPKIQRLITPTIRHRRRSLKKRVENRRKRSYLKRKAYFSKLTRTKEQIQKSKAAARAKAKAQKQRGKGKRQAGQQQPRRGSPQKKRQGSKKKQTGGGSKKKSKGGPQRRRR